MNVFDKKIVDSLPYIVWELKEGADKGWYSYNSVLEAMTRARVDERTNVVNYLEKYEYGRESAEKVIRDIIRFITKIPC